MQVLLARQRALHGMPAEQLEAEAYALWGALPLAGSVDGGSGGGGVGGGGGDDRFRRGSEGDLDTAAPGTNGDRIQQQPRLPEDVSEGAAGSMSELMAVGKLTAVGEGLGHGRVGGGRGGCEVEEVGRVCKQQEGREQRQHGGGGAARVSDREDLRRRLIEVGVSKCAVVLVGGCVCVGGRAADVCVHTCGWAGAGVVMFLCLRSCV